MADWWEEAPLAGGAPSKPAETQWWADAPVAESAPAGGLSATMSALGLDQPTTSFVDRVAPMPRLRPGIEVVEYRDRYDPASRSIVPEALPGSYNAAVAANERMARDPAYAAAAADAAAMRQLPGAITATGSGAAAAADPGRTVGEFASDTALRTRAAMRSAGAGTLTSPVMVVNALNHLLNQGAEGLAGVFGGDAGPGIPMWNPAWARQLTEIANTLNEEDLQRLSLSQQWQQANMPSDAAGMAQFILQNPEALLQELVVSGAHMVPSIAAAPFGGANAMIGTGAMQQAQMGASDVEKALLAKGADEQAAMEGAAAAFAPMLGLGVVAPRMFRGGSSVERLLSGRGVQAGAGGAAARAARPVLGEAGSEAVEEGGIQALTNIFSGDPVGQGVGGAAVMGGSVGALMGGGPAAVDLASGLPQQTPADTLFDPYASMEQRLAAAMEIATSDGVAPAAAAAPTEAAPRLEQAERLAPSPAPSVQSSTQQSAASAMAGEDNVQAEEAQGQAGVEAGARRQAEEVRQEEVTPAAAMAAGVDLSPRAPAPATLTGNETREELVQQWRDATTADERAEAAGRVAAFDAAQRSGSVADDGTAGAGAAQEGLQGADREAAGETALSPELIESSSARRERTGYVPEGTPEPADGKADKAYLKANIDTLPDPSPEQLPDDPAAYFDLGSADAMIPTGRLVPSKKERASATALRRMAASADGFIPKRGAIDVRDNGDGTYTILDGNGSHAAATAMGLSSMPVRIVEAPAGREGWRNSRGYLTPEQDAEMTALYEAAASAKGDFDQIISTVAGEFGAKPIAVPLKGRTRAEQKTRDENGGNVSKLNDVLRGSIVLSNPNDAASMIDRLRQSGQVIKEKNAFDMTKPSPYWGGYRDAKVIFQMPNGARAEVILMTEEMEAAKERAHKDYEIARKAYADLSSGVNASDNITAFIESLRRMGPIYAPAEEALRMAANSSSDSRQRPSGVNARAASDSVSMRGDGSNAISTGTPPGPGMNAIGTPLSGGPANSSAPAGGSAGTGVTPSENVRGVLDFTSAPPSSAQIVPRQGAGVQLPAGVEMLGSPRDLPESVRRRLGITDSDMDAEGVYDPDTGRAYVFEDNIRPFGSQTREDRIAWVAAHERSGHAGLRGMFRDAAGSAAEAARSLMTVLDRASRNDTVRALVRAMEGQREERGPRAVEEALAELAAAVRTGDFTHLQERYGVTVSREQRGHVRALLDRIVDALRRALGLSERVSDAEIFQLIEDAGRYADRGIVRGTSVRAEAQEAVGRPIASRAPSRQENRGIHADAQATINVGLSTAEVAGGGMLTPARVRRVLKQVTGLDPLNDTRVTSQSEPTLVVDLERPLTAEEGDALSRELQQEAIAQRNVDGSGDLFGPQAENWGPYNPEFFMLHDGLNASVEAPGTKPPTVIDILYGEEEAPRLSRNDNIARWLEQRTLDVIGEPLDIGDPAARDLVADAIADEAIAAMDAEGNALEWYDSTIRRTMGMLALKHPEIETDPDARTAYTLALAITSLNMSVSQNVQLADAAYESYRNTGRFSSRGAGKGASVMEASFQNVNALLDELGSMAALRDFMDRPFTVRELRDMGYTISGENIDTEVQGSAILGPKIGTGFYQNLNGNFSPVTIDLWFMRTIGRLTGQILNSSADSERVQRATDGFRKAMAGTAPKGLGVRKTLGIDPASVTEDQLFDVAMQLVAAHEKDYRNNRAAYDSGRRVKSKQVYAAEALKTAVTGLVAAPRSGNERNNLRDIVRRAVDKVAERTGQEIPAASLQAVIWYPEQELYRKLGSKQRETSVDYATAVKALLEKEGYDARELERAAGSSAEPAQRGDRGDVASEVESGRAPRSRGPAQGFSAKKRQPDATSVDAYHYSTTPGLTRLDPSFAGTAGAGRERRRFGMGRFGERGGTAARLGFYVREEGAPVPQAEDVVSGAGGRNLYRVQLDNLYDLRTDPRGFAEEAGMNQDMLEEEIADAGFDGFVAGVQPGIDTPVAVVFDIPGTIPVESVSEGPIASRATPADAHRKRNQLFGRLAADGYRQGSMTQPQNKTGGRFVGIARARDNAVTILQDKMNPLRRAQQRVSVDGPAVSSITLDDAMNAYRLENLMHGAVNDELKRIDQTHIKAIQDAIRKSPFTIEQFEDYLYAKAAPERNREIAKINSQMPDAGSGITTKMAGDILDGRADGVFSGERLTPDAIKLFDRLNRHVRALRDLALDNMVSAGQIPQQLADSLRQRYPNYVPMRGKDGELDEGRGPGSGRGISQRAAEVRRALGRGADNIPTNILGELVGDAQRSVVNKGKAKVARAFLRFALAHPQPDLYTVEPVDLEWKFSEATGEAYLGVKRRGEDINETMLVMHEGNPVYIRITDPDLRDAILNMGVEDMGKALRVFSALNRWRSAVLTRFSPAFTPVNMARDLQFGTVAIAAEHGASVAARTVAAYPAAMRAAYRHEAGRRGNARTPINQRTMSDWAAEAYAAGMSTGVTHVPNVVDLQRDLVESTVGVMKLAATGRPLAATKQAWLRTAGPIIEAIENANGASENAIRLAVYVTLRKDGWSVDRAAEYAKNVTINFNRKGRAGSILNAIFLFYNAAVQGTVAVARVLRKPQVLAYLGGLAALQGVIAAGLMDDDDDDGITEWDKIPDYVKRTSFIIPLGDDNYFALPMPYGFNWFTYLGGRGTQRMLLGDRPTDKSIFVDLAKSLSESFSPIPLQDGYRSLFGDQVGFAMGIASNTDDFGSPIAKSDAYSAYDSPRALEGKVTTPQAYHWAAQVLAEIGGGDLEERKAPVGWLDIAPEHIEETVDYLGGGITSLVNKGMRGAEQLHAGNLDSAMDMVAATPIASRLFVQGRDARAIADRYYGERGEFARHKDIIDARIDRGMSLDEAIADRPQEYVSGMDQARYKVRGRRQDGTRYRRGDPRVDSAGRPVIEQDRATPPGVLKDVEKRSKAIGKAITEIRGGKLTNEEVAALYDTHYRTYMATVGRVGQVEGATGKPSDIGLPEGYDASARAPTRVRNRTIKILQDIRAEEQRRLLRSLEFERRFGSEEEDGNIFGN